MFTGLIEARGTITAIDVIGGDRRIQFDAPGYLRGVQLGDSIAVNGVCLTAVRFTDDSFTADLSAETLNLTTAGQWQLHQIVNLERALTPAKPLGGHLVSGHVDGVGSLLERFEEARSTRMRFEAPSALARYIARKGSICIDGISLTVNDVERNRFGVNIVPHTLTHTSLGVLQPGAAVNLEIDLIARYLERLIEARSEQP